MDRELPHDKIPHAIRKKARAKGVANALLLMLFLGVIEVCAFYIFESRLTAEMESAHWREMTDKNEHLANGLLSHERRILASVLVFGAVVLAPILGTLGWKNGNYCVVQKWYLDALATNATRDKLTGVLNHRGIVNKLDHAAAIANRRKSPLTIVFVDVVGLEKTNEKFGPGVGDRQVVGTARALLHTMRQTDIIGRLRDDEFLVALIDCELPKAEAVMERAARQLAQRGIAEVGDPWTMEWRYAAYTRNESAEQLVSRTSEVMDNRNNASQTA